MSDNTAIMEGYTQGYNAYCGECDLYILVKPETDLDSCFKAWDSDNQEFIYVNGWLWTFERTGE